MTIGDDCAVESSGNLSNHEKPVFAREGERRFYVVSFPQLFRFVEVDPVLFAVGFAFGLIEIKHP
ncbi:MAG: hypothetical protein WD490_08230 [Opitutales bacterium]